MGLGAKLLWGVMGASTLFGIYTGQTGYFVPPPVKDPVSVREGTPRSGSGGTRIHYFRGGGVHYGK